MDQNKLVRELLIKASQEVDSALAANQELIADLKACEKSNDEILDVFRNMPEWIRQRLAQRSPALKAMLEDSE